MENSSTSSSSSTTTPTTPSTNGRPFFAPPQQQQQQQQQHQTSLAHMRTVHNETCGCDLVTFNNITNELNKAWQARRSAFIELHKARFPNNAITFDDFLSRILRVGLATNFQNVSPMSEGDFWLHLRGPSTSSPIEDELADIHNFILEETRGSTTTASATPKTACKEEEGYHSSSSGASQFEVLQSSNIDELTRLKRKEKHMAPIDCTGVSSAYNLTWYCKPCGSVHTSKNDCATYRPIHDPKFIIDNDNSNAHGLPNELIMRPDGVYVAKTIRALTRLGPLIGSDVVDESKMDFDEDRSHVWLLYGEDGRRRCIMTDNKSNWVSKVSPAESASEAACWSITMDDNCVYLVTTRELEPGTKLTFFSKEDPTVEFWTSWTQAWANQRRCTRCSVHGQFDSVNDYRVHIALWHDLSFQGNPQNRIYYCPDCNAKHIGAKDVVNHCKDAHGSLPFQCRHCAKRFETYNSLIKHKNRIHAEEKPLRKTCPTCGKVYLDPKALKQHVKQVHERSEQLHCSQCEMILSSKYALNRHVKEVHNRQQEHICPQCKKHFTQQSNLKQHMLIHFGVKPFLCEHDACKSAFTTKQCLQVHYRKVHRYSDENMPAIKRQPFMLEDQHLKPAKIPKKSPTEHPMQQQQPQQQQLDDDSSGNNSLDTSTEFEMSNEFMQQQQPNFRQHPQQPPPQQHLPLSPPPPPQHPQMQQHQMAYYHHSAPALPHPHSMYPSYSNFHAK